MRDEVQGDKVLDNGLIVAVDQVADGFNHAILDVAVNTGHEAEIQDCQPAIWSAHHVARVGISLHALGDEP